jgi:hypothetical protein
VAEVVRGDVTCCPGAKLAYFETQTARARAEQIA